MLYFNCLCIGTFTRSNNEFLNVSIIQFVPYQIRRQIEKKSPYKNIPFPYVNNPFYVLFILCGCII